MFEDSFHRVVLTPANNDLALRGFPGTKTCGRGHGPFNSNTSVLCYCLCYQRTHFESLEALLEQRPVLDCFSEPVIIDVGAGPATVPLAIAQRYRRLRRKPMPLRYVDIEHSRFMRGIATQYLNDATLFTDVERISYSSVEDVDIDEIAELADGTDVMIVALSYVLNQQDVPNELVGAIADLIAELDSAVVTPVYILIQDASGGFRRHDRFLTGLRTVGCRVDGGSGRITQPHRETMLDGTVPEQTAMSPGNVVYWLGPITRLA